MTLLYFMRHGQAESGASKPDENRQLTAEGHRQSEAVGRVLVAHREKPSVIFCSPRTRAIQTAEHVATALDLPHTVNDALDFSFSTESVRKLLGQHPDADIMFVGHQPSMSEVIGEIAGARVIMETASIACIHIQAGILRGELVWFVPPSVARTVD